ncbi:uncharacterized protein PRCAT00003032001 [Priceomyces carsonii]|uniref:uncharacterized protein n=1 Tax=Priceomyces carsonii TaxID=28549 RepID=UPI002ED8285F|nr:unnamed protein product [Priceomyces carsonii]
MSETIMEKENMPESRPVTLSRDLENRLVLEESNSSNTASRDSSKSSDSNEFKKEKSINNSLNDNMGNISHNSEIKKTNSDSKRGPSTPISSLRQSNRRKLEDGPRALNKRQLSIEGTDSKSLVELNYKNWLLTENFTKSRDLLKFMELERKYAQETS